MPKISPQTGLYCDNVQNVMSYCALIHLYREGKMEIVDKEIDWRLRVFDSMSFPTVILQPDKTIVAANKRYLEKIGVEESQIVGRSCREINLEYYPDQKSPCNSNGECPLAKALKYRTSHSVLLKYTDRHGDEGWEERVFSPILGADWRG